MAVSAPPRPAIERKTRQNTKGRHHNKQNARRRLGFASWPFFALVVFFDFCVAMDASWHPSTCSSSRSSSRTSSSARLPRSTSSPLPWQFYLSVGAIFRDEDRYLSEWLEFHLCQGVEHFFLYNHHSASDDHERILSPYIAAGLVTLDQAACDLHCQVPTYTKLYEQHAAKTRWLALIDIDEFLMPSLPSQTHATPSPSLAEVLVSYERFPAVVVHWLVFGSSNLEAAPAGLVVETYVWRANEAHESFKTVAQTSRIAIVGGHNHQYLDGESAVNDKLVPIPFNHSIGEAASSHNPPSAAVLRLHHYRTKSREHAIWRFKRDSTFRLNEFDNEDIYPSTPETQARWLEKWDLNEIKDESAKRYLPCIRCGLTAPT